MDASADRGSSGRQLTRLLARWADAHRLSDRQAEAIRQTVVTTPVPRGFDWWWRLLDPVTGTAFRATRSRTAFGASWVPERLTSAPAGVAAWARDEPGYQPYLRLT
jgi:hypothetical protein